jgi:uncharacterized protein YjbI with pentapeptide repeats
MASQSESKETTASNLLKSLNTSANTSRNNWLAFLALLAYLTVTVSGVTHKDLLLDAPVKLPIVGTEVSLSRFFGAAPIGLALLLFGLLLQHDTLARKAREFDRLLLQLERSARGHNLRHQVSTYFFIQHIAGPQLGKLRLAFVYALTISTLSLLPLLVAILFQLTFLPYHSESVTLLHQAVCACIAMSIVAAPYVFSMGQQPSRAVLGSHAAVATASIAFSFLVATVPDSTTDRLMAKASLSTKRTDASSTDPRKQLASRPVFFLTAWFFGEGPIGERKRADTAFSRNLVVTDTLVSGFATITSPPTTAGEPKTSRPGVSLRGRNFRYAIFDRSQLSGVDFTGADLSGASLVEADLQQSVFKCSDPSDSYSTPENFGDDKVEAIDARSEQMVQTRKCLPRPQNKNRKSCTDLTMANLSVAKLHGADLQGADLRHARLANTQLEKANLRGANLCFADSFSYSFTDRDLDLAGANLIEANFFGSSLFGAIFDGANMEGTDLSMTTMGNASFRFTKLYATKFSFADADGANFISDRIERVILTGAHLKNSSFLLCPQLKAEDMVTLRLAGSKLWQSDKDELDAIEKILKNLANSDRAKQIRESIEKRECGNRWTSLIEEFSQKIDEYHPIRGAAMLDYGCRDGRAAYRLFTKRQDLTDNPVHGPDQPREVETEPPKRTAHQEKVRPILRAMSAEERPVNELGPTTYDLKMSDIYALARRSDCQANAVLRKLIENGDMTDIFSELADEEKRYGRNGPPHSYEHGL